MTWGPAFVAEQGTHRAPRGRPGRFEQHLLGAAGSGAMMPVAKRVRPTHNLLQPLRPLAQGWQLGLGYARHNGGLRRRRPDDRYDDCAGSSARSQLKKSYPDRYMGRARDELTTKVHVVVDADGLPVEMHLTPRRAADNPTPVKMLGRLRSRANLLADKAYDADWLRWSIEQTGRACNIPLKSTRIRKGCFSPALYRERNRVARSFNRIKHFRRVATRYEKQASSYLAMLELACVKIWMRFHEFRA